MLRMQILFHYIVFFFRDSLTQANWALSLYRAPGEQYASETPRGSDLQKKGIMGIVCLHCGDGDLSYRCVQWVSRPSSLEHHRPLDTDLYDVISCFED